MTNEQYNAKCEATHNFREFVAGLEAKKEACYHYYAAYYIVKHGLYRDVELTKAFLKSEMEKTSKMKKNNPYYWDGCFKKGRNYDFEKQTHVVVNSLILQLVKQYAPSEMCNLKGAYYGEE